MYTIEYLESVVACDIKKLDKTSKQQIKRAIEEKLTIDPVAFGKPLQYSLKSCRRLRVGDWRVIFQIDHRHHTVIVVKIGHRKEVYQD